jgi:hypothetical protein
LTRRRRAAFLGFVAILVSGCISHAPRIADPVGVDANCGSKQARVTSMASVISSTDDKLLDARPTEYDVRRTVRLGDGVLAYYNDQLLALPRVSQQLGEADGYARVRAVGIGGVPPEGAPSRNIYLLVRDHKIYRWIEMQAFDVQNVCVEGKRES